MVGTPLGLYSQRRLRQQISLFEARLVYIVHFRTAKNTQREPTKNLTNIN